MRKLFLGALLALLLVRTAPALADELRVGSGGYDSLTEAVAAAAPGDVIRLTAGVYAEPLETYPIEIDKPLTLIGEPGTVLEGPPFKALVRVTVAGVTLEDLDLRFRRWGVLALADGLTVAGCDFTLADTAYRVSSCGIWLAGAYNAVITNNAFGDCGLCIAGPPVSERSESFPVLTGLFEVGEDTALFTSHKIEGNTVNGKPLYYFTNQQSISVPKDAGQAIVACCQNVTVEGQDVSGSSMGLEIVHCRNVEVRRVKADRCGIFGVYLAHVDGGGVEGVSCLEANHGIDIRAAQSLVITGCDAIDCEQGIFLTRTFDCLVDSCRMIGCGNGFFISAGAGNQLSRSLAQANENGVYLQGADDVLLWGNQVEGNIVAGMRILKSGGQFLDNDIHDNWVGMLVAESQPVTVVNNTFSRNTSACLYLRDTARSKIALNCFQEDCKAYLEMEGTLAHTLIYDNAFQGGMDKVISRIEGDVDLNKNR